MRLTMPACKPGGDELMPWKALIVVVAVAWAQAGGAAPPVSPYAGQETRPIKALSEDEIQAYLSGSGMGFAKAAELNRYPGPRHVLDLADRLALSDDQRRKTERIFESMRAEAVRLGGELVARERELDSLFAAGTISSGALERLVVELGSLQGRLRAVHLRAHLAQREVLTPEQRRRYDALRGYDAATPQHAPAHRGH
jgi:Spy/CpxP family protein refolding chaperone